MRSRTNFEIIVGIPKLQSIKENPRHVVVVVLAAVNEVLLAAAARQLCAEDRRFDKLRPGADNRQNLHTADSTLTARLMAAMT